MQGPELVLGELDRREPADGTRRSVLVRTTGQDAEVGSVAVVDLLAALLLLEHGVGPSLAGGDLGSVGFDGGPLFGGEVTACLGGGLVDGAELVAESASPGKIRLGEGQGGGHGVSPHDV